jgi:putative DNA primase/helicase
MPPKTETHKLDIAIGKNRWEKNWKNREMTWSDFVNRVRTTHRTAETFAEYMSSKKTRQDEIKDVGGFVGGYLSNGRRKPGNVVHRQLITLDADSIKTDLWEDFQLIYACAAVLYSTHKHEPEAPRYRLIIPLDRPVMSDEYQAIARRIAGLLGIENFDPTTFQPERLMYWPSTSKDGEYVFQEQEGPFLRADTVLSSYHDWHDSSEWPVSAKVDKIIQRGMAKQGDPLEKHGLVGAFCRSYTISEVIETYLSHVYESCTVEGRFTYKEGSTAAGLVVYDDKYAYSHHGTDPISGKLCNAFDLVRLHLHGLKDEDAAEDCPSNRLPSFLAMQETCTKDAKVKQQLASERVQEAKNDFELIDEEPETPAGEDDQKWMADMEIDRKGNLYSSHSNIKMILDNDPKLKGCFGYDEFKDRKICMRNLPWRKVSADNRYLRDEDEQNLVIYLSTVYGILNRANTKEVLDTYILKNSFHPVRDYLNGLHWDGIERLDSLFIDYMGAEDSAYTRAVSRKTLVAAVARVFNPGCKFDYVLTLVGEEGLGKSSLVGKLAGQWFSDSFNFGMLQSNGNKAYEQIQGFWLIEIGELTGFRKADIEAAKQFISKREDSYRVAYGRNISTFKRQCIFIGSTNDNQFLREANGNRRFWPLKIKVNEPLRDVFTDLTEKEIGQIWAEALYLYRAGETLFLDRQLEDEARSVQEQHTEQDDRAEAIVRYLDTPLPENWESMGIYERRAWLQSDDALKAKGTEPRNRVSAAEIWCELFGGTNKDMNPQNTRFIHTAMRKMKDWKALKYKQRLKGFSSNQTVYERVEEWENAVYP